MYDVEYGIKLLNDKTIKIRAIGQPVFDEQGEAVEMCGVSFNLSALESMPV